MGAIHPPTPLSTHEQYDNDWVSINFGAEAISDVLLDGAAAVVVVTSVTDDDAAAVAVVPTVADAGTCVFFDDAAEDIVVAVVAETVVDVAAAAAPAGGMEDVVVMLGVAGNFGFFWTTRRVWDANPCFLPGDLSSARPLAPARCPPRLVFIGQVLPCLDNCGARYYN